jgi:hypothetical protein
LPWGLDFQRLTWTRRRRSFARHPRRPDACGRHRPAAVAAGEPASKEGTKMEALIALGVFALIWVVVIWGSAYVNKNVQ